MSDESIFEEVRFTSPSQVFANNGKNVKEPKMLGPLGKIPSWKTVDFFMGNYKFSDAYEGRGVNWRKINLSGIDFSSNPVNENVLLIPEKDNFKIASSVKYGEPKETLGNSGGILDMIKGAAEIFSGASEVPAWEAKTFEDLENLEVDGEFEFKFRFGNAGLYNAFEEVVKPILALTLYFGIEVSGENTTLLNAANRIKTPMPTQHQFLATKVKGIIERVRNNNSDLVKNLNSNETPVSYLAKANAVIQSALATGAKDVSLSQEYRNLYMSWGRFLVGPLIYDKFSYSFKMTELDTYGWPIEGSFVISGLKSMRKSTAQAMISPFVKGV